MRRRVVFVACLLLPSVALAQPLFGTPQDPLAGSRVFGAKGCVKCHTINGVGGEGAPDLGRIRRPRSFYDLATAMWNHAPRMAERMAELGIPKPQLDSREAGDLVAFLFTVDYFDPPGRVDAGRQLFTEKRCVVCHQVGGTGGVVGPNLDFLKQYGSPIFLATAMWNHGPQMSEAMQARGIARPTFKDAELRDLIAYVNSASPVWPQSPGDAAPTTWTISPGAVHCATRASASVCLRASSRGLSASSTRGTMSGRTQRGEARGRAQ